MQSIWVSGDAGRTWRTMGRGLEFRKSAFPQGLENTGKTLVIAKDRAVVAAEPKRTRRTSRGPHRAIGRGRGAPRPEQ